MNQEENAVSPLPALRVLDLTDEKGLLCARILGDLGADVIKVEKPGGDPARNIGPFYHDMPHPERSLSWFAYNANKRGITLNIESRDGQQIFKRLVKDADFVIESFPPGYMRSLGLDYEALSQIDPRIIVTSVAPFGQTGPKAQHKASDLTCFASGGALYVMGYPDRPPNWVSFPQSYLFAGAQAALGSMIAYYHRELTGEGQHVDVSIQESVIGTLIDTPEMLAFAGIDCHRAAFGFLVGRGDIAQTIGFPCKDGWVVCFTVGGAGLRASTESLEKLRAWMAEEGMAPDWFKGLDWTYEYSSERLTPELICRVEAAIGQFLATRTKTELYEEAIRRQIIIAPVNNMADVWQDAQLRAREFWQEVRHPELGDSLLYCGAFVKLGKTPLKIRRRAPLIGEHNQEIYEGELGLCPEEVTALKQAGVI